MFRRLGELGPLNLAHAGGVDFWCLGRRGNLESTVEFVPILLLAVLLACGSSFALISLVHLMPRRVWLVR